MHEGSQRVRKGVKEKLENLGLGIWEEASLQIKIKSLTANRSANTSPDKQKGN